jgi:hypothetical protein
MVPRVHDKGIAGQDDEPPGKMLHELGERFDAPRVALDRDDAPRALRQE